MIDVFVRSSNTITDIRSGFRLSSCRRWEIEGAKLHYFMDWDIRAARIAAEIQASSDPYIFSDDDVIILGRDWIKRSVEVMLANPEYAIVSSLSLIEGENLARPGSISGDKSEEEMDIYPMHAVGQPMLIRQGIIKEDLPDMTLDQECGVLHRYVLDKGYKEGLLNPKLKLRHNHLGSGFSSNPALHWGA